MHSVTFGEKLTGKEYFGKESIYPIIFNSKGQVGILQEGKKFLLPKVTLLAQKNWEKDVFIQLKKLTGYSVQLHDFIGKAIYYHNCLITNQFFREEGHFFFARLDSAQGEELEDKLIWLDPVTAEKKVKEPHQSWALKVTLFLSGKLIYEYQDETKGHLVYTK